VEWEVTKIIAFQNKKSPAEMEGIFIITCKNIGPASLISAKPASTIFLMSFLKW
jgi:hypothetical protein